MTTESRNKPAEPSPDRHADAVEDGLPLAGVTVVACEQAVAGPMATRHLADLGARVIKVERPDGGDFARAYDETVNGMSSHFVWLNRSKESIALDLKDTEQREILHRLISRADVFVQNLSPRAARKFGLTARELRARNPRLITCTISGYGDAGPYRDTKAYDLLIQSEVGLLSITGSPGHPAKCGIPVADIGAGMYAFSAILAALYQRQQTGRGAAVSVNLFDALVEWMGYPIYYTRYGGTAPQPTGASHAAIAPYGPFESAEGTSVVIAVQNDREWRAFCAEVLLHPELIEDPLYATGARRVEHSAQLTELISSEFRKLSMDTILARLEESKIASARQRRVEDVLVHPQLLSRERWTELDTPVGPVSVLKPPIDLGAAKTRMGAVPRLGEHTSAILRSLAEPAPATDDAIPANTAHGLHNE